MSDRIFYAPFGQEIENRRRARDVAESTDGYYGVTQDGFHCAVYMSKEDADDSGFVFLPADEGSDEYESLMQSLE